MLKKKKLITFAETLKNEVFGAEGAEIFLRSGPNLGSHKPPPLVSQHSKTRGGFVARNRTDAQNNSFYHC